MEEKVQLLNVDEKYVSAVEMLAKGKVDAVFPNSGEAHALVVFVNMFKTAEKHVNIFSQSLRSDVPNSLLYCDSLDLFLSSGGLVNVLVESTVDKSKPVFRVLSRYKDRVKLYEMRDKNVPEFNFTTADGRGYRLEYNKQLRSAKCNFNDRNFTGQLNNVFNSLCNKSVAVSWD